MRVRLTHLFDFWFENYASQAMSTENFPFLGPRNGLVWENEVIFEKLVNLSKNFQKLFLQTATAQRAQNLLLRCITSDQKENCPLSEGHCMATESCPLFEWHRNALNGNEKLPLVWMTSQHTEWQQKVTPCLDDAAAHCNQSSEWRTQPNPQIQRRQRWPKPSHGHNRFGSVYGWTSEWSCLRIPNMGIKPYVVPVKVHSGI